MMATHLWKELAPVGSRTLTVPTNSEGLFHVTPGPDDPPLQYSILLRRRLLIDDQVIY